VAVDAAFLLSRFAAAVAWPRALPIAEFAPLSHMLINGFFLVQGFFILVTISGLAWSPAYARILGFEVRKQSFAHAHRHRNS
jgi:hypothetical protein